MTARPDFTPYLPPNPGSSVTVAALAGHMARIAAESADPHRALSQMLEATTTVARGALADALNPKMGEGK